MVTIIGLGNPGEKFKATRHNIGFMAVDFFAKKNNLPDFSLSKKYHSLISENEQMMLAKPQTFMNESGKAVKKILKKNTDLIVIHDDIDLPLGKIRIVKDRGAGGHKGVHSIIEHLGRSDFIQFKIGICPETGKPKEVEKFVIKKFTNEEQDIVNGTMIKISEAIDFFAHHGLEKTMNQYNGGD